MHHIIVKYNKAWGVGLLVSGVVLLIAQVWVYMLIQKGITLITMITSFLIIFAGIRYLIGIYFELTPKSIKLYNLYGNTIKTYTFSHIEELHFVDNKLFIEKEGNTKHVRLSKVMADAKQWQEFVGLITSQDLGNELHDPA